MLTLAAAVPRTKLSKLAIPFGASAITVVLAQTTRLNYHELFILTAESLTKGKS